MLMIRPQPFRIRCGATTCDIWNVPLTLTCTDSCQMSGLDSQNGRKFPAGGRPGPRTGRRALLTSTCSAPNRRMLSANSRSQSPRTVMSVLNGQRPARSRLRIDLRSDRLQQIDLRRRQHDTRAGLRQRERHRPAEPDASPGHCDDRAVEVDTAHRCHSGLQGASG